MAWVSLVLVAVATAIPVNVMMPLDMITSNGVTNPAQLQADLAKLKSGGVDGVMSDVWWGLVELSPKSYNWAPYLEVAGYIKNAGLKWQVVMSFHRCGGNVGDDCNIPLPSWVLDVGSSNKDIWYRDREANYDEEYLSLGVDNQAIFGGRTPIVIYKDFMASFRSTFAAYLGANLTQVQVGMGPCGETRYPSYQLDKWSYCGVGEFQSYDKYMLAMLSSAANAAGHPEWGTCPSNAGTYNSYPSDTGFFTASGNNSYASPYGEFFLDWYLSTLVSHASSVLGAAKSVFSGSGAELCAKVSGIHWWYGDDSHAAELTAGYYNTNGEDAYARLATVFKTYGAAFDFTCLEMTNSADCGSRPEYLVKQTILDAFAAGVNYDGENALDLCSPYLPGGVRRDLQGGDAVRQHTRVHVSPHDAQPPRHLLQLGHVHLVRRPHAHCCLAAVVIQRAVY
eukprot:TRINITY_DN571_c0_g2_i1.p1 TRINITY_DN571_c0_g2~~TRINITY_DN571_c0_g2_i1.p1  ORF type:complete len:465 (-),score=122.70 TRINITY_DN571_c0_g2_i1:152-1504(-)